MRGRWCNTAVLLLFLVLPASAWAWPPTYGAEFEFISPELEVGANGLLGGQEKGAAKRMADAVRAYCAETGECTVEAFRGKWDTASSEPSNFEVKFKDGWWFRVSYDPACVEVQTKPSTLAELRNLRDRMVQAIFEQARKAGFTASRAASGHVNVGADSAFDGDVDLFLRHFVDLPTTPSSRWASSRRTIGTRPPWCCSERASAASSRSFWPTIARGR